MRVAIYPGSFDPITFGHVDVLRRSLGVFDRVVVAVLVNPKKAPMLDVDARVTSIISGVGEALA